MRRLILLLALPLAGCWTGDSFYVASDSRPALPPGSYRAEPSDHSADAETLRVSMRADGMTSITDSDGDHKLGFAPLGGTYYVMWYREDETRSETLYALFESAGGRYRALIPFCARTKEAALAAGGQVEVDPKLTTCLFKTRAQLEDGLRRLEGTNIDSVAFVPAAPLTGRPSVRVKPKPAPRA